MTEEETRSSQAVDMRKQAEAIAHERNTRMPKNLDAMSPEETRQTLHELHVHQIELEIHNEELRRTQEQLDTERARYFDLYDLAPVGYCTLSEKGLILEANLTAATLLGLPRGALVKQPIFRFIHKDDEDIYYRHCKRLFATGKPQMCELRMVKTDGTELWAHLVMTAAQDPEGLPMSRIVMSDINDRKRMEKVQTFLVQTGSGPRDEPFFNALSRYLAESLGMDFICIDRLEGEGLTARTVAVWCDGKFEDNVSYALKDTPCGEVVGKAVCCFPASVCQFFPRDQVLQDLRAESYVGVTLWGHTGQPIGLIAVIGRRPLVNRSLAEEILKLVAVRAAGEMERLEVENERQLLQERLQRAEKMESLGLLAGGVAHDLNNVLGIVVGYAELILDSADASSSIKPHLVNIMNGGQKAAAIVNDLLTLARRGVSGKEVLNLNEIIANSQHAPEFEKLYSYHPAVKINTDLEPDQPNITCSSMHLGKSLYNLVSNACEAMPKGGIVTIKTTSQYLEQPLRGYDEIRSGDYVVLSVSDTGEGIPAADLKRIFEPFYTKKVMGRSGTGLGLAVVWGTVKDHHAYINVQSEKGKGSTFTLYFPVTKEAITAGDVPASLSEYMGKGESILVVDDVKEQRDLATGLLTTLNYNVSSVPSGEEAVKYLKDHQTDLMVLDMIMDPGMDGLDTYSSIIKIRPKQKAILVSGFSESDRVHEAQGLGAGAYVKKPYVKEKLGVAVRKELDRK